MKLFSHCSELKVPFCLQLLGFTPLLPQLLCLKTCFGYFRSLDTHTTCRWNRCTHLCSTLQAAPCQRGRESASRSEEVTTGFNIQAQDRSLGAVGLDSGVKHSTHVSSCLLRGGVVMWEKMETALPFHSSLPLGIGTSENKHSEIQALG